MIRLLLIGIALVAVASDNARRPKTDSRLRYWLQNMIWDHRFTTEETSAATGMTADEVTSALNRFGITDEKRPKRKQGARLRVVPYPGGRHPRIGFLDGAVDPQRETKVSVFTPWDDSSYVVVDVPEAIWSNLGLTYLAHTHVPTIWTKQGVALRLLEWNRRKDGTYDMARTLPNGIQFGTKVIPRRDWVDFEMWLTNGTKETLSDLRVQVCAMLKGAQGFTQQTNDNKLFRSPYVAVHSEDGKRWIITAWERCFHAWGNAPCPCLHSDPKFEDCPPGGTKRLHGRIWFYNGESVEAAVRSGRFEQQD